MPNVKTSRIPRYTKHAATGQARVRLNGRDIYLGPYGSPKSRAAFDRTIAEWIAKGRSLHITGLDGLGCRSVNEVAVAFLEHCKQHYRKPTGEETSEVGLVKLAIRPLRALYGMTPAASFGPLALKAVRQAMIDSGLCRNVCNKHTSRLKQLFRWACENELVPPAIYHGLVAVKGLQAGRTNARETAPVRPAPVAAIEVVKAHVSAPVRGMIDMQLLTGARPGEICSMRGCDLEMTGRVWVYRPATHKCQHHGHTREVYIGPQAQEVLKPFLKLDTQAFLFSPWEAREQHFQAIRSARKTPVQPSQESRRKRKPERLPGDRYDTRAYAHAIKYACKKAFPLPDPLAKRPDETTATWQARLTDADKAAIRAWRKQHNIHPNMFRHNSATRLRRQFGIELARVVLGHSSIIPTQIYAEIDRAKAREAMLNVG